MELIGKDLVFKEGSEYKLSPFGRESIEAYHEYKEGVIPTLVEAVAEAVSEQLGAGGWEAELKHKLMTPTSYHPVPALLRIMEVQSHPHKMRMLTVLSGADKRSLSPSELCMALESLGEQKEFPRSTASNYVTQLERALVVKRTAKGLISLTPVGDVSIKAFLAYQYRLRQPLFEMKRQRLAQEFGLA